MPRSPSGCEDVDGRSAGATMPQRRRRLLRSRTPGPACEAQPQLPDQQPKPRSPGSPQFHSSSDTSHCGSRRRGAPDRRDWGAQSDARRRRLRQLEGARFGDLAPAGLQASTSSQRQNARRLRRRTWRTFLAPAAAGGDAPPAHHRRSGRPSAIERPRAGAHRWWPSSAQPEPGAPIEELPGYLEVS
jgi:hypothetical protein